MCNRNIGSTFGTHKVGNCLRSGIKEIILVVYCTLHETNLEVSEI